MDKLKSNTCLAVVRNKKGKLLFAGDRRVSWGMSLAQVTSRPKVIKREGMLFAGTGSAYICDLIIEVMHTSPCPDHIRPFDHMHNTVFNDVVTVLEDKFVFDKKEKVVVYEDSLAIILVAVKGELFQVVIDQGSGIIINSIAAPFATGCGGAYALGALLAMEKLNLKEEVKLTYALQVAAKVSPGCDDNIDIIIED